MSTDTSLLGLFAGLLAAVVIIWALASILIVLICSGISLRAIHWVWHRLPRIVWRQVRALAKSDAAVRLFGRRHA